MATLEFRFRPPAVPLDAASEWAFARAFGPPPERPLAVAEPERALACVRRFDLGPRLVGRQRFEILVEELGEAVARELTILGAAATAETARLERTARRLAEVSAAAAVPMVFLKHQALWQHGVVAAGARLACDVDVLVPARRAREVAAALAERGYAAADYPESEHQLSVMTSAHLSPVEIHRLIPGLRLPGHTKAATIEALLEAELVLPLELPGQCLVPVRPVMVAHALVHGLAQHGLSPRSYAMTRMLADLIDLGLAGPGGEDLVRAAYGMIEASVARSEVAAVQGLCRHLVCGDLSFARHPGPEPTPEVRLLHHILAGVLDPAYGESLRLALYRPGLSDHSPAVATGKRLWRALFKTRAELDGLYGPSKSWLGYLGKRLRRPFDLVVSLRRYRRSHAAVRRAAEGVLLEDARAASARHEDGAPR